MGRGDGKDQRPGESPQLRGAKAPTTSTPPSPLLPPPAPPLADEPAEVAQISIWIKPLDESHDQVQVEIDATGYDAALRYDYDIPTAIDAAGPLSAELLRKLITRELVRDIARELQVKYEDRSKRPSS